MAIRARRRLPPPTADQLLILADRAQDGPLTAAEADRLRAGISQLAAQQTPSAKQRVEAAVLRRRLAALHHPMTRGGEEICPECSGWDGRRGRCLAPLTPWPCPTAQVAQLEPQ